MTSNTPQIHISTDRDEEDPYLSSLPPTDRCCFCIPYDVFMDDFTDDYNMHSENKKKKQKRMRKIKEDGIRRLTMFVLTGGKRGREGFEVKKSAIEMTESQLPERKVDVITGGEYVKNMENQEKRDQILAMHGKTGTGYKKNEKFDFFTRISLMVPKLNSAISISKKSSKNSSNHTYGLNPETNTCTSGSMNTQNQLSTIKSGISGSITSEDKRILNAPERPGVMTEIDFKKNQKTKDQKEIREKGAAERGKMRQKTVYYKSNSVFGRVFEKRQQQCETEILEDSDY